MRREEFINFVESKTNYNEERVKNTIRVFDKFNDGIKKNIKDINKEDLVEFVKNIGTRSYGSLMHTIGAVNDILTFYDRQDIIIDTYKDIQYDELLDYEKERKRYFTKNEIINICNAFPNPQDKFIVYGIFSGIHGQSNSNLINLKSKDIDLENKKITLPDRVLMMDEYMFDVCSKMLDREYGSEYYKYLSKDNYGNIIENSNTSYSLNFDSEYAIKTKPYSKNNDGLDPMKTAGVRRRLAKLSEVSGVVLSPLDIKRSGIMNRMHEIKKAGWTVEQVKSFLLQHNFKMQAFELHRLYNLKYGNK